MIQSYLTVTEFNLSFHWKSKKYIFIFLTGEEIGEHQARGLIKEMIAQEPNGPNGRPTMQEVIDKLEILNAGHQ